MNRKTDLLSCVQATLGIPWMHSSSSLSSSSLRKFGTYVTLSRAHETLYSSRFGGSRGLSSSRLETVGCSSAIWAVSCKSVARKSIQLAEQVGVGFVAVSLSLGIGGLVSDIPIPSPIPPVCSFFRISDKTFCFSAFIKAAKSRYDMIGVGLLPKALHALRMFE